MVKWDSDKNLFLVLKTLETHCPKLTPNANAIIDAWPKDFGEKPTKRAIAEQWQKVRALSRKGKGGNASSTNGVSPRKGNAPISAARVKKEIKDESVKNEEIENDPPLTDLPLEGNGTTSDTDEVVLPFMRTLVNTPTKPVVPESMTLPTPTSEPRRQTTITPTPGRASKGYQERKYHEKYDMMEEDSDDSDGGAVLARRTLPMRARRVATYKEDSFRAEDESDVSEYGPAE